MSAVLEQRAGIARQVLADLAEAGPWPMPVSSSDFNDDDLYVYDAKSLQLVRTIGCKSIEAANARSAGLQVRAGQTWGRGLAVKHIGLWRPA